MTACVESKDSAKLFLITGATGFLGSHLAIKLARKGYSIIALIRTVNGESGSERFMRLCRLLEADSGIASDIDFIEGDIGLPRLGLGMDVYNALKKSVSDIINCAADTSFSEKRRESVERTNIHGLRNLLKLAEEGSCSCFHQISTAYVAGKVTGICKEELTSPQKFTNVYEETKCRSEHIAAEFCERAGIRLNIYRPGIVCGDSGQGRTFLFNGLYYPLKSLHRIIEGFKKDMLHKKGERARRMGVKIVNDKQLFLPLSIGVPEGSGINIIPVDYFTYMFMRIMEDGTRSNIFHIVQKENCAVMDLIGYISRYFNIEGLETTSDENNEGPVERIFNLYNEPYLPYIKDKRVFSVENSSHLGQNAPDDRFTYERFRLCMDYAVKTGWGKFL